MKKILRKNSNITKDIISKTINSKSSTKTKVKNQSNIVNKTTNNSENNLEKSNSSIFIKETLSKFPKDKPISIYSWNVAGLRAILKKDNFTNFIKKENPDILCLNETKINEDLLQNNNINSKKSKKLNASEDVDFFNLLGDEYQGFYNCSTARKGYSGVAIFTKYKPISVKYGIGHKNHDSEGRVITMEFDDFYIVSTYIPNAGEGLKRLDYRVNSWDKSFQNYLISLKDGTDNTQKTYNEEVHFNDLKNNKGKRIKHVIWIGDVNVAPKEIDIHNPKSNLRSPGFTIEERTSFSEFLNKGFVDTFRDRHPNLVKYSYFSYRFNSRESNRGWRLDNTVVNKEANKFITESDILDKYTGSDHCPIKVVWHNISNH